MALSGCLDTSPRSIVEVTFGWLKGAFLYLVTFALVAFGIFWLGSRFNGPFPFLLSSGFAGAAGIVLALIVGIPSEIREELADFGTRFGPKFRKRRQLLASLVTESGVLTAIESELPPRR